MPFKDLNKRRVYRREWYARNKISEKKHVYKRKKEIKKWFEAYKNGLKCTFCGEDHPSTIDFHHRRKEEKKLWINIMVHEGYSLKNIKQEIEKCEILCANCHRKHHYKTVIFKTP